MKLSKYIILLICLLAGVSAEAQISYETANLRADRFFEYREWASAAALYNHLLKEKPDKPETYGRAIVTNAMLNDSTRTMQLLNQAMAYNIPLDSVLSQVRKYSFIIGRGQLYEQFMLQAKRDNSWMQRPIDNQLLKYYTFRNNGAKMIEYAQIMLKGGPDNTRFLADLAKGYMLQGETTAAAKTWRRIVEIDPENYLAILCLANYYRTTGDTSLAESYFRKAAAIQPTPYIERALAQP